MVNGNVDSQLAKSFEITISILLSISLASFLLILVERIRTVLVFIVDVVVVATLYVSIIYLFTFYKLKYSHFLVPRTILVIALSIFPYMVLRTYTDAEVVKLTNFGIGIYTIVTLLFAALWGFWEGLYKEENPKIRNGFKDYRFITASLLLVIIVLVLMNGGQLI